MFLFSIFFALPEFFGAASVAPERLTAVAVTLRDILPDAISGFSVFSTCGYAVDWPVEHGAGVQFSAPDKWAALGFAAAIATTFEQELVYLADYKAATGLLVDGNGIEYPEDS